MRGRTHSVYLASLCWACLSVSSAAVVAQTDEPAQEERLEQAVYFSDLGRLHFDNQRFPEAAEAFAQAWEYEPDEILGYNAARSFENSGELERALEFYEATLALEPSDEALARRCRDAVVRLEAMLVRVEQVEQAQPANVEVNSNPQGARVFVDDVWIGVAPIRLQLEAGTYRLRLEFEGRRAEELSIEVEAGEDYPVNVALFQEIVRDPAFETVTRPNWMWVAITGGSAVLFTTLGAVGASTARDHFDSAQTPEVLRDDVLLNQTKNDGESARSASVFLHTMGILSAATAIVLIFVTEVEFEVPIDNEGSSVTPTASVSSEGGWMGLDITF